MKPLRKRFDASPAFPFSFVYRDTKTEQSELPDHLHDWYELVYVHSGKGSFFIDREIYDMGAGDLFAIPGNTIHRAFPDREDPVTSTAVFFGAAALQQPSLGESFSYLRCFELCRKNKSFKLVLPQRFLQTVEPALASIHDELNAREPGYRHAVMLHLQSLLLGIGRAVGRDPGAPEPLPTVGPAWLKDALLHIDRRFAEPIGLAELAERAAVSPAHFSRLFKRLVGMNVTEFIATKRIIRAMDLLADGELGISVVAESCGFESMPHFHRTFKRIAGMTPAAYRKNRSG